SQERLDPGRAGRDHLARVGDHTVCDEQTGERVAVHRVDQLVIVMHRGDQRGWVIRAAGMLARATDRTIRSSRTRTTDHGQGDETCAHHGPSIRRLARPWSSRTMSVPDDDHHTDAVLAEQIPAEMVSEVEAVEARGEYEGPRDMHLLVPHFHHPHICGLTD